MVYTLIENIEKPYFLIKNNVITYVNDELTTLTLYSKEEFLGKSLLSLSAMLRVNPMVFLHTIKVIDTSFIFTKSLEAREVTIEIYKEETTGEDIFTFFELPNSRLEEKLLFVQELFSDNLMGVKVLSAPDFILLKANQEYIDLCHNPCNKVDNYLGKYIHTIIPDFAGSKTEALLERITQTKKSVTLKGFKYNSISKGIIYLDYTYMPILENGKLKYIFTKIKEVTKKVEKKHAFENQRKQLDVVIENMSDAVYIINSDGHYISSNKASQDLFPFFKIDSSQDLFSNFDFYDLKGNKIPKENSPYYLVKNGSSAENLQLMFKNNDQDYFIGVRGIPILDSSGDLIMGILCISNLTDKVNKETLIKYQANLVDEVSDAIISIDDNLIIRSWNKAAELIYGWSPKEAIGENIDVLLQSVYLGVNYREVLKLRLVNKQEHYQIEVVHKSKYNKIINIICTINILKDTNGNISGSFSTMKDITIQKRADSLSFAMESIRKLIHSTLDFDKIMSKIILEASKAINSETGIVFLREEQNWISKYSYGLEKDVVDFEMSPEEELHANLAVESKKTVVINNVFNPKKLLPCNKYCTRSILIVPLLSEDHVIGVIFFNYYKEAFYFNKTDIDFAENLGSSISMAFRNVKLYEKVCSELSERKRLEEELRKQKKQLETIIENISDGISIINSKGQFISYNKSARDSMLPAYKYLKKDSSSDKNLTIHDINGEDILPENLPTDRIMAGQSFKNMRLSITMPKNIIQLNVSGTPIFDSYGNFSMGVIFTRDITDSLKHEQVLNGRYEFLIRMLDNLDLPVIRIACPELEVININQKALNIIKSLGPNVKLTHQLIGQKILDILKTANASEYYEYINSILKEKKTKYLNSKSYLINGKEYYWNIIFEPVLALNGEIQEIIMICIDITNEVNSNIIMEKSLKTQEEFFANISHELKTPLNVIYSAAQLFDLYCKNGSLDRRRDLVSKYLNSIMQNSYRLSKLINNIVDLSKIEAGFFDLNLSNNNIVSVVEEIITSVSDYVNSKGLDIIFDTDKEEIIIGCDPEKIERIVLNLLSNAIKFSNQGDKIFVNIIDKSDFIEIYVKDSGIGIGKAHMQSIFERFIQVDKSFTRNAEGTGIGLSLVKSLVELHDGKISVESELGKGSEFKVVLPTKILNNPICCYNNNFINSNRERIRIEFSDIIS